MLTRTLTAVFHGARCHALFGLGVGAMILALYFGMSRSLGTLGAPWSYLANAVLLLQFPLGHSLFLMPAGHRLLARLGPANHGKTLATTTYATIASVQLLLLFGLWTPSGVIWWQAEGAMLWLMTGLFGLSWLLLLKASFDAGPELQSGFLGWWALLLGRKPKFPEMPVTGLFRLTRQPIYVTFAMTLWTVPVWTPDQLAVSTVLTAYCVLGPRLKERRFERMFGDRFERYREGVPYWIPSLTPLLRRSR
ncbi:MAG: isoprenylcysteine carboxylmethyltransferase family protein [Pseudomonadota bacterium]